MSVDKLLGGIPNSKNTFTRSIRIFSRSLLSDSGLTLCSFRAPIPESIRVC